ncbi:hypothetical protein JCM10207_003400 [Rhodosporidiobolus poonsookiae]
MGGNGWAWLGCPNKPRMSAGKASHCSFRVHAARKDLPGGQVKVTHVCLKHDCDTPCSRPALEWSPERAKLKKPPPEASNSTSKAALPSAAPTKVRVKSEAETEQKPGVYPSAAELSSEVDAFVEISAGPITLPCCDDAFPPPRALFIRLHAYARQRGFTLFRRGSSANTTATHLCCSKLREASRAQGEGECHFAIKVASMRDGTWKVVKAMTEHSHGVKAPAANRGAEKKRAPPLDPPSQAKRRRVPSTPASPRSASATPLPLHPPQPRGLAKIVSGGAATPPILPRESVHAALDSPSSTPHKPPPTTPDAPFSEQLASFLSSVLPPTSAANLTHLTHLVASPAIGLSSTADLVDLIFLDAAALDALLDDAQRRGLGKGEVQAVAQTVGAVGEAAAREGVTAVGGG